MKTAWRAEMARMCVALMLTGFGAMVALPV